MEDEPVQSAKPAGIDGTVRITDGRVVIEPPEGNGRYPTIQPGNGVEIRVNGKTIKERTVLIETDQVQCTAIEEPPIRRLDLTVSQDGFQADLLVEMVPGKRWQLGDIAPNTDIIITCERFVEIPPQPYTLEDVLAFLREQGISVGIDIPAVQVALARPNERVTVARGVEPIPAVDESWEFFHNATSESAYSWMETFSVLEAQQRPPAYGTRQIPSVEPGQVLAAKNPGRPGRDGLTVRGEVVPVGTPQKAYVTLGDGVAVVPDGSKIVATRAGRPSFRGKTVEVLPIHIVPEDVDPSSGEVAFSGDVLVYGDVKEGAIIRVGGDLHVSGFVAGATVAARGSIRIGGSVFSSSLSAGGRELAFRKVREAILPMLERIDLLVNVARQVKAQALKQKRYTFPDYSDTRLVQLLLVSQFSDVAKQLDLSESQLNRRLRQVLGLQSLEHLTEVLRKPGGSDGAILDTIDQLTLEVKRALEIYDDETYGGTGADIEFDYAQNAAINASGCIVVKGKGCYYSSLTAGKGLLFRRPDSVFRGGTAILEKGDALFGQLGAPGGSSTSVSIRGKGTIIASSIYAGVTLSIDGASMAVSNNITRPVRIRPLNGKLVIEGLPPTYLKTHLKMYSSSTHSDTSG